MSSSPLHVLGLSGSLRAKSINTQLLRNLPELMPAGMRLTIGSYADIPLYNQDTQDQGMPASVTRLANEILKADALVISSPEYNASISGVLKNAIDWLSRPAVKTFKDKPIALMSVSPGTTGGARSQNELRKVLTVLEGLVLPRPEIFVGSTATKFDANGKLTDEATRTAISDQLKALQVWTERVRIRPA